MAPQIRVLQQYRDQRLVKTTPGRWFIKGYNTFGPILANWLKDHPRYRSWVRRHIVAPAVHFAERKTTEHENH